jgi:hypothetical protein
MLLALRPGPEENPAELKPTCSITLGDVSCQAEESATTKGAKRKG